MIGLPPHQAAAEPRTIGRYAVLTMDELELLIPQHQVHALEPAFDVQQSEEGDASWIAVAGLYWPVYCLSKDLRPIREVPANRHICVLLESGTGLLGVLCDQVVMIDQTGIDILPLPRCMRTPGTPLNGLVLQAERVLCATSADALLNCVGLRRDPAEKPDPQQLLQGGSIMSDVNAWLLDLGGGLHAAVGELEMIHVLPDFPTLFDIPRSPVYARQVLAWQDEVLPLMNLAIRLAVPVVPTNRTFVAITAFQDHPRAAPRYGALMLDRPPVRIRVNDSLACELSEVHPGWRRLAIACFRRSDLGPVPVLDLGKVFSMPSGGTDE